MAQAAETPAAGVGSHAATSSASKIDPRGPVAAVVVVGSFLALTAVSQPAKPGALLPWTLNPTGYLNEGSVYALLYFVTIPAKELMNVVLSAIATTLLGFKRMDEGDGGKVRKLEVLETVDLCYLALNTIVEFIGMNHIAAFLADGPLEYRLRSFSVMNGPLAFVVAMCINDIIYYPFHLIAHRRTFYPYCHKQHHRQFVPFRGYADAANQHPLEQLYGFSIFIVSLYLTSLLVGLHAGTAWFAALAWAILNIANHLAFDSRIHLPLPYPAYPRDHQMHHRFPQCNYSTLTSFCDRIGGTYRRYRPLGQSITDTKDVDSEHIGRPEAVPSVWSVAGCAAGLLISTLATEAYRTSGKIELDDLTHLWAPVAVTAGAAVLCAAAEGLSGPAMVQVRAGKSD